MGTTLDQFVIVEHLGDGAGSKIWQIRDRSTGQHFAMKVVIKHTADDQKYLDQALHEFEIARKFDHPNLVKFYDVRQIRRWFRVREVRTLLEYVCGRTIESLPDRPVPLLVLVFGAVADAVSHMHGREVYHADLKPNNNIMIAQSGDVKVIDYGLAWLRGQNKMRVQGTPGYLAPEQVRERLVNSKTDIFNLGATMHRMLSPRQERSGAERQNMIAAHGFVFGSLESLNPEVPRSLSELVARCCDPKPNKRPESMVAVRDALNGVAEELGVSRDDLSRLLSRSERVAPRR